MDNKALPDVATGIFRLRKSDRYMTSSTIVDLQDDELMTLTTVEVCDGVVMLRCFDSTEAVMSEDEEEDDHESEESEADKGEADDEDEDQEEGEDEETGSAAGRTYTVASGNSVTVRAAVIRLEPIGKQTAEGTYRVQMLKSA